MKNFLLIALLAGATIVEAAAQTPVQDGSQAPTTQTGKTPKKRKYTPELYKGTVAKQRRVVTEAPGAQKDKDTDDETTAKSDKASKKNN